MSENTKQAGVDWPTVLKMLAGGAFLGSGIGAGTSYLNQLGNLKEDSIPEGDDKNTLYINLPGRQATPTMPAKGTRKRASDENSGLTYALGGAGMIAGTYAAYNVIRSAYQNSRKRQLQKELDQAHQVYMGKLSDSASLEKGASQFPPLSKGVGLAYLALLATGVGSGIVANKILDKQMPPIEAPNRYEPKKIVIRTKSNPDESSEKEASSGFEVGPDEIEALLRQHLEDDKRASVSGFKDLVAAAAQGRCREIQDNVDDLDTLLDMVKGASLTKVSVWKKNLAITWLAAEPEVSETIAPVLAAEFADANPGLFKMALWTEPRMHKALAGLVKAAVVETRRAIYAQVVGQVKQAETVFDRFIPEPAESLMLANSLQEMLASPNKEKKKMGVSSSVSESPEIKPLTAPIEADDDEAARFLMEHKQDLEKSLATAA